MGGVGEGETKCGRFFGRKTAEFWKKPNKSRTKDKKGPKMPFFCVSFCPHGYRGGRVKDYKK